MHSDVIVRLRDIVAHYGHAIAHAGGERITLRQPALSTASARKGLVRIFLHSLSNTDDQ